MDGWRSGRLGPTLWVDVETTGLDPATDRIVSVAVVERMPGEAPRLRWTSLADPGRDIPHEATRIHRIDAESVRGAPPWEDVVARVQAEVAAFPGPWGAYNAPFDGAFLGLPLLDAVDPLPMVRIIDRYHRGKRLVDALSRRGIRLDAATAHGAVADAIGAAMLWARIAPDLLRERIGPGPWIAHHALGVIHDCAIEAERDDAAYRSSRGLDWTSPWHDILGLDIGIERPAPMEPTHRIEADGSIVGVGAADAG